MTGLIIATSIIGTLLIATIVFGAIKMYRMNKNMTTLAECLLAYMTHPESVDIVEDYFSDRGNNNISFPNSEGF